ncbi:membrane-bound transcription factor site-1 protease-like [Dorcoceras hygrometricum]|uniref:Membrane-bound transcription factor site-1 protease-like n=1 Tax=Dorcoceras hygrometricum TaxID=472368 RepID=A0A2Z7D287_9LAMI|nr:membrane-bound transcription factor site-1 protease-like [Dorcoceras hygrometricum]
MGTQTQQDKAGNTYEVKPQYEELSKQINMQHAINQCYECMRAIKESLGGRHSNPVVTTPTIALDFSDTTQQSASHNVAPNQILNKDTSRNNSSLLPLKLPRQIPFKIPRSLNLPKIPNILAQTNERKLTQRIETHGATYCSIHSSQEVPNATKNSKNGGRNQREITIESDGEQ